MATCGPNPPPPAGTVIWRGTVPAELTAWAISLRDQINKFPDWTTWTTTYNGQTVVARRDRHDWTYRNGQLITGICIPGITLYKSSLAQPVSASTDPTDLSTPDPTAAIFSALPPSIDWQAVAIAGFAATGVIGLFWLAIQGAGHAAEKAKRLPGARELAEATRAARKFVTREITIEQQKVLEFLSRPESHWVVVGRKTGDGLMDLGLVIRRREQSDPTLYAYKITDEGRRFAADPLYAIARLR